LRCAVLLKPLYACTGAPTDLNAGPWLNLMRASMSTSDNAATTPSSTMRVACRRP